MGLEGYVAKNPLSYEMFLLGNTVGKYLGCESQPLGSSEAVKSMGWPHLFFGGGGWPHLNLLIGNVLLSYQCSVIL